MWKIEYENDTGSDDGAFWEWWNVTDGTTTFRANCESDAANLVQTLNKYGLCKP